MGDAVLDEQADGGSEFMQEFEAACRDAGIPLAYPPAPPPDSNGSVTRSNRTLRTEFWSTGAASGEVSRALEGSLLDHHNVRPHHALGLLTPAEFADKLSAS